MEEHDCNTEYEETSTAPDPSGSFVTTRTCTVCGRVLAHFPDSIL